jgi:hypothetical protein
MTLVLALTGFDLPAQAQIPPSPPPPAMTLAQLKRAYPNAEIKVVSEDEMKRLQAKEPPPLPRSLSRADRRSECSGLPDAAPEQSSPPLSTHHQTQVSHYRGGPFLEGDWSRFGGGGGHDKNFLIVVAVIGVVVVAALFIYAGKYIYEAAQAGLDCKAWDEIGFRASFIDDDSQRQRRYGQMLGLTYTLGYDFSFGVMGLKAEAGGHRLDLNLPQGGSRRYEGAYALLGPHFDFPITAREDSLYIDLLAGTSSHRDIGLISRLHLGLQFLLGSQFYAAVDAGAALTDVKGLDGYLQDEDQLNFLSSVSLNYRF